MMKTFEEHLQTSGEVGFVEEVNGSLIYASGLPRVRLAEIVVFEPGSFGQVLSFSPERSEILSLAATPLRVGSRLTRTGHSLEIPVGEELLGRVVDPFCRPLDLSRPLSLPVATRPVEVVSPPGIAARRRITAGLETGVALVDLLLPLGRGQRELIIGDRKTGKTSFLLQVVLAQARRGTVCIFTAIGKRRADVKKVEEYFRREGLLEKIIIVAASPEDPAGVVYLAPFTGMTLAEYFRDQGRETLVVFDDLLSHAKFYREIALLGRRFPGRDSYPGDIFYLHARLLERAGNFVHPAQPEKTVSITCLPVVETVQGDLTGYIQSNLMAMTDGHLYFDGNLFAKGRRPAINPFLSVTRVGRQTQSPMQRDLNRDVTALLALYEKSQGLAHFGLSFSENIKQTLSMGDRLYSFFDQPPGKVTAGVAQIVLLCLIWSDYWQKAEKGRMQKDLAKLLEGYDRRPALRGFFDKLVAEASSFNHLLNLLLAQKSVVDKALKEND